MHNGIIASYKLCLVRLGRETNQYRNFIYVHTIFRSP